MELSGIQSENTRPESSGSGLTATDSHGVPTELSPTEEEGEALLALENSGSSEDGRMQPLLKVRHRPCVSETKAHFTAPQNKYHRFFSNVQVEHGKFYALCDTRWGFCWRIGTNL